MPQSLEEQSDTPPRPLEFRRNAIGEWDHVASHLAFEGEDRSMPRVTIAVTTYQRPGFLHKAVRSALTQETDVPFEIVVVDNDPASTCLDGLLAAVPELKTANFRYFVHAENMGIFGNFNRAITLARGTWLSILNDDDLLHPDYIDKMFAVIDADATVDGIICGQALLDERRSDIDAEVQAPRMTSEYIRELLAGGPAGWSEILRRGGGRMLLVAHRLAFKIRFKGGSSRRIRPATFFWGPVLGNGAGFLFRTAVAKAMGGFYVEEFPASDLFFYARFAHRYHLRQHREIAATYRMAENESAKLGTALGALLWIHKLQLALAGTQVPKWWLRLAPMMIARMRGGYWQVWRLDIPKDRIESLLKMRVPKDREHLSFLIRFVLGGL